jgi:hypothetical protein
MWNVFRFTLKLALDHTINTAAGEVSLQHTRVIPSSVKKEVWARDKGRCVICGDNKNLHFDHDLPYSLVGTS